MSLLHELARAAGLSPHWRDYRSQDREVAPESLRALLEAMELPAAGEAQQRESLRRLEAENSAGTVPQLLIADLGLPTPLPGAGAARQARLLREDGTVRELRLQHDGHGQALLPALDEAGYYELEYGDARLKLAVTPPRCYGPGEAGGGRRMFGVAAQLYALRRAGDGGIGNFSALSTLLREAAGQGADAVAISPVHALFSADVNHYSPYSPSSRLFLNALHTDPAAQFGADRVEALALGLGLQGAMRQYESQPLLDWPGAAAAKLTLLRALYEDVHTRLDAGADPLGMDYRRYIQSGQAGGARLREHATFEALHAAALAQDPQRWHWRDWPAGWRDPDGPEVIAFAAANPHEIGFHMFLQWLAERGLRAAQAQARNAGMGIGVIADLAVGTSSGGSHVWSRQHDVLAAASVGAPPDDLNGQGQSWGLTAFSPRALRLHGYEPFIETLRASLRHAGGLRIDHVLGLNRLWLVPEGAVATEGAYLAYPLHDLLRLLALESWRHRAIIVGEDLGTVPDGFRQRLAGAGILGMQVLWFERDHGYFIEPARWSTQAMATTGTHDVAPVAGWWRERDLDWRARLELFAPGSTEAGERGQRARDRRALWAAFNHAGVTGAAMPGQEDSDPAVDAAIDFVGRTPSPLAMAPVEDLLGLDEQVNIPGTVETHPNWRRRLPGDTETLLRGEAARRRLNLLKQARQGP